MRVLVHVRGLKGAMTVDEGEEAAALLDGVLEVDGHLIEEVSAIEVEFAGGQFATVKAHLIPGAFEVVSHTRESWPELLERVAAEREARGGADRLVAMSERGQAPRGE